MIYKIQTDKYTLFDIDYFVHPFNEGDSESEWGLDIRVVTCVGNLLKYTKDNISDDEFDEFTSYCDEINELRGWLFETHNRKELCSKYGDINKLKFGKIKDELETILNDFCKKYHFVLVTD